MLEKEGHTDTALVSGSNLILLGKAEAVVGLQSLYVVSQVNDRNGRVLPHSWERERKRRKRGENKEKSEFCCSYVKHAHRLTQTLVGPQGE